MVTRAGDKILGTNLGSAACLKRLETADLSFGSGFNIRCNFFGVLVPDLRIKYLQEFCHCQIRLFVDDFACCVLAIGPVSRTRSTKISWSLGTRRIMAEAVYIINGASYCIGPKRVLLRRAILPLLDAEVPEV